MLFLGSSWLVLYLLTSVLGFGLLRLGSVKPAGPISQTETILAGLIGMVAIAQLTSLLFATDYRLAAGFGLLALVVNYRFANQPLRAALDALQWAIRQPLCWLLLGVVLVFSLCTPGYWDAGMYHIPSIRWYERFGAVPGLGNLHGRLAFNSSFFVLSAAFAFTDVVGQSLFPLNGFLLLVFGSSIIRRLEQPDILPGLRVLLALLLGLTLYYLLYPLTSPTPDVWATLLPLFMLLLWFDGLPDPRHPRFYLFVALGLLSLTVKLGTLPVLLFVLLLLVSHRRSLTGRRILPLVLLATLIVGPWLVRNVILSGYLLYPLSGLDLFAVDWKIPISAVHHEEAFITFWARFHLDEAHLNTSWLTWPAARWLPIWWRDQGNPATFSYFKLNRPLFVLAGVSPVVAAVTGWRSGWRPARLWWAYGVMLAGFVFWFVVAPEFRFGLAFIWPTALLPWVPLLSQLPDGVLARLSAGVLGLLMVFLSVKVIRQKHPLTAHALYRPNWLGYRDMQAEGVRYQPHRTQSGLIVLIPERAVFEQRCYEIEQPAPCTPYFYDDLQLRGTTLEDGFRRRSTQHE